MVCERSRTLQKERAGPPSPPSIAFTYFRGRGIKTVTRLCVLHGHMRGGGGDLHWRRGQDDQKVGFEERRASADDGGPHK